MSRVGNFTTRLYRGEVSYDFVGRTKIWYTISAVILILACVGLFARGLNLGIEFKGGAEFVVPSANCSTSQVEESARANGVETTIVQTLGDDRIRLQSEALNTEQGLAVANALAETCGVAADDVRVQLVGPTWGGEITKKALTGLAFFMVAIVIFLSIYFEWRMAIAALIALVHDVVITIGIYALVGFEVTPATVIGVLTILGFSLYDTVVVFDKVKENTKNVFGQSRNTYAEIANLALNQTVVRSINTTVVAVLPVAAILFVGVGVLGAGTLKDLALALFIGLIAGTFSSIFIATPALVQLKSRQPQVKALEARVMARRAKAAAEGTVQDVTATASSVAGSSGTAAATAAAATAVATERVARPHRNEKSTRQQPRRVPRSKR